MLIVQIVLLTIFLFAISATMGYLLLKLIGLSSILCFTPAIVCLPFFIIAGFCILLPILTAIGFFTISSSAFFILILLIMLSGALSFKHKSAENCSLNQKIKSNLLSADSIFILIVFGLVFCFFVWLEHTMLWPPVGDVLAGHGPYTSVFMFNGKLSLSLQPLASWSLTYSPSFHVFAADLASWFVLLPGEAILLFAGSIMILFSWLMFSLTYYYTQSKLLSLVPLLACFIFRPGNLTTWLMGFFYNGTYPFLLAILLSVFSVVILSLIKPSIRNKKLLLGITLTLLLIMLTLAISYTPYVPIILLELVYLLVVFRHDYWAMLESHLSIFKIKLFIALILVVTAIVAIFGREFIIHVLFNYYSASKTPVISISYFYDHVTGPIMIIAAICCILFVLRKKYLALSFVYLSCFLLTLLTLLDPQIIGSTIFRQMIPDRLHMVPWLLCWSILAILIYDLSKYPLVSRKKPLSNIFLLKVPKTFSINRNIRMAALFLLFLFLCTVIMFPSFSHPNANSNWYTSSDNWGHDYSGLLWIKNNVSPNDLILNDYSWAGLWVLSFSFKNTTSNYYSSVDYLNRTLELNQIWSGQLSVSEISDLILKYNVSYVFTTSETGYYKWATVSGGSSQYINKPIAPNQYILLFSSLPFLELKFKSGNTALYAVNKEILYSDVG